MLLSLLLFVISCLSCLIVLSEQQYFALGSGQTIMLKSSLLNSGDDAFLPRLTLRFPNNIHYIKVLQNVSSNHADSAWGNVFSFILYYLHSLCGFVLQQNCDSPLLLSTSGVSDTTEQQLVNPFTKLTGIFLIEKSVIYLFNNAMIAIIWLAFFHTTEEYSKRCRLHKNFYYCFSFYRRTTWLVVMSHRKSTAQWWKLIVASPAFSSHPVPR